MDKRVVSEILIKASSINCFRASTGKRNMLMPYWVDTDTALVFEFIGNHTKISQLQEQIEKGKIWVRECDFEA